MKRITNLGKFLKARRKAFGLTQRSLAQKLGVEASYVAFIEGGRRKPSLKLVNRLADTLGLDRREVLLLSHPELDYLRSPAESEPRRRPPTSWQRFTKNSALLARYHVTKEEFRALEHLSLLGTVISTKEFLTILTLIRDIPGSSRSRETAD